MTLDRLIRDMIAVQQRVRKDGGVIGFRFDVRPETPEEREERLRPMKGRNPKKDGRR